MAAGSSKRRRRREKRAAAARADGGGADDQSGGFGSLEGAPVADAGEVAARARLRRFLMDRRDYPERWLGDGHSFFEGWYESFCRG